MNSFLRITIICFGLSFVIFIGINILTTLLVKFKVVREIEKRYNTRIQFHPSVEFPPWGFITKYSKLSYLILMIYLNENNIFKNKRFETVLNPLLEFKYDIKNEKSINIKLCLINVLSLVLSGFVLFLGFFIGYFAGLTK